MCLEQCCTQVISRFNWTQTVWEKTQTGSVWAGIVTYSGLGIGVLFVAELICNLARAMFSCFCLYDPRKDSTTPISSQTSTDATDAPISSTSIDGSSLSHIEALPLDSPDGRTSQDSETTDPLTLPSHIQHQQHHRETSPHSPDRDARIAGSSPTCQLTPGGPERPIFARGSIIGDIVSRSETAPGFDRGFTRQMRIAGDGDCFASAYLYSLLQNVYQGTLHKEQVVERLNALSYIPSDAQVSLHSARWEVQIDNQVQSLALLGEQLSQGSEESIARGSDSSHELAVQLEQQEEQLAEEIELQTRQEHEIKSWTYKTCYEKFLTILENSIDKEDLNTAFSEILNIKQMTAFLRDLTRHIMQTVSGYNQEHFEFGTLDIGEQQIQEHQQLFRDFETPFVKALVEQFFFIDVFNSIENVQAYEFHRMSDTLAQEHPKYSIFLDVEAQHFEVLINEGGVPPPA